MRRARFLPRILSFSVLTLLLVGLDAAAAELNRVEKEQLLRQAKIIRLRGLAEGITNSQRATLSDGRLTHDAHVQTVDIRKTQFSGVQSTELNFRDTYQYNLAASKLDELLGLDMVPVTVERKVQGKTASLTWWVDDTLMTEKQRTLRKIEVPDLSRWNDQMYAVRIFDQLIYNTDRNLGNLVIDKKWNLWMIDHTRGFRAHKRLKTPADVARIRCDRRLFTRLQQLDEPTLENELGRYLMTSKIRALLTRRDKIVEIINSQIAERGEDAVFCDIERH